jgi:hypothetical protein
VAFPVLTGCPRAEAFCLRPTSKPSFLNSSGVALEAGHPTCVGQLNLLALLADFKFDLLLVHQLKEH